MFNSRFAALTVTALVAGTLMGCAAPSDDELAEDGTSAYSADRVLGEGECKSVTLTNRSTAAGTFEGPLSGCVVGGAGESGKALTTRAAALMGDLRRLADMRRPNGSAMWRSFEPSGVTGSLASAGGTLAFDAKIGIDITGPFDAKGTVSFAIARTADGRLTLRIRNKTAIGAAGAAVIEPGKLRIDIELTPAKNGIVVTGTVAVTLAKSQSYAGSVSSLGPQIVQWLDRELTND